MSDITVGFNKHTRVIPESRNALAGVTIPERSYEETDADFPYLACCGSVSAIAWTSEGAVEMVERILATRARVDQFALTLDEDI